MKMLPILLLSASLVLRVQAIRHPAYGLPKPAWASRHPAHPRDSDMHLRQSGFPAGHGQQALSASQAEEGSGHSESVCQDANFYLDTSQTGAFGKSGRPCPPGFRLARLDSPEVFRGAAVFVFGCLGPAKEAWVASAMGTIYGEGDPVKLVAPDAIEKGGVPLLPRPGPKDPAQSRRTLPGAPLGWINVRSVGQVELDQSATELPFLCQAGEN